MYVSRSACVWHTYSTYQTLHNIWLFLIRQDDGRQARLARASCKTVSWQNLLQWQATGYCLRCSLAMCSLQHPEAGWVIVRLSGPADGFISGVLASIPPQLSQSLVQWNGRYDTPRILTNKHAKHQTALSYTLISPRVLHLAAHLYMCYMFCVELARLNILNWFSAQLTYR
jgi:hypothetical protein